MTSDVYDLCQQAVDYAKGMMPHIAASAFIH